MLINPSILVEMIQCAGGSRSGVHFPLAGQVVYALGESRAFSTCFYCRKPIFSDLKAREQFLNPTNPMSKFTDADGHLWVAQMPTYIIREEEELFA